MKTFTREFNVIQDSGFNFKKIQLFAKAGQNSFRFMGAIKYHQKDGETNWYGMSYLIETDRLDVFRFMTKIAKHVEKNVNWETQPDELLKIIGAQPLFLFNGDFVLEADRGKTRYEACTINGVYCYVIASNEKQALKQLKTMKPEKMTLQNPVLIG